MTTDELILLAVVGSLIGAAVLGVLAVLAVRERRRRRTRSQHGTIVAAAPPVATRPPVVIGPPRPWRPQPGECPGPAPIRRGLPLVIPSREDPLWQEKGWRRTGRGYEGAYRAGGRQWRGLIQEPYPGSFDAYIWQPPLAELARRTSHRPCFNLSGMDGRFKIHFHTMPRSLDHAIASVEAVLAHAMGAR